jgi:hypothetical protein
LEKREYQQERLAGVADGLRQMPQNQATSWRTAAEVDCNAQTQMISERIIKSFHSLCVSAPQLVNDFRHAMLERLGIPDLPNEAGQTRRLLRPIIADVLWTAIPRRWLESAESARSQKRRHQVSQNFQVAFVDSVEQVAAHSPHIMLDLEEYRQHGGLHYETLLAAQLSFYTANRKTVPY